MALRRATAQGQRIQVARVVRVEDIEDFSEEVLQKVCIFCVAILLQIGDSNHAFLQRLDLPGTEPRVGRERRQSGQMDVVFEEFAADVDRPVED